MQHALREPPQACNGAPERLQVGTRGSVLWRVQSVRDDRGVGLGHHERLDELVRGHGGERLDLVPLSLEFLDTGREAVDLELEDGNAPSPPVDRLSREVDRVRAPQFG